jgi:hypothetical protein
VFPPIVYNALYSTIILDLFDFGIYEYDATVPLETNVLI